MVAHLLQSIFIVILHPYIDGTPRVEEGLHYTIDLLALERIHSLDVSGCYFIVIAFNQLW
jgi:hypothetical protein